MIEAITREERIQQAFRERMDESELLNCMRCGFCLPYCPTYIETDFDEVHSPRGRIALMKAVYDGVIAPDEEVEHSLNVCLGCRACEPVCPAGVSYGHLLEEARDIFQSEGKESFPEKLVRKTVFEGLFPYHNRMIQAVSLLRVYQKSGLQKVVRKIGFLKLFSENLQQMEKILPEAPKRSEMKNRPRSAQAAEIQFAKVAFFSGCLMDTLFLSTNEATIKLLQKAGCDIVIPKDQGCCGALHGHSGEKEKAKELAKRNIDAFLEMDVDYIIINAGGCGAYLLDYEYLLKDDPEYAERAREFSGKIKDVSQILVDLRFHERFSLELENEIITYQDSCHLRNVMKTDVAPRTLLNAIKGSEFREMERADSCCGSAGIYNLVQPEMSMKILDRKMENVQATHAHTIVTANPGCLLQMKLGIERAGLQGQVRAVHIVDLLLEALMD